MDFSGQSDEIFWRTQPSSIYTTSNGHHRHRPSDDEHYEHDQPLTASVSQASHSLSSGASNISQGPSPPGGFFKSAHSFDVHGGQFMEAGVMNVYNNANGARNPDAGLKMIRKHMAPSALHDSAARFDAPKCDEDTRTGVIEEIMNWLKDRSSPTRILCMTGPAGTGKSALEQTITEMCESEGILAASFFFSATDASRNTTSTLIPTIAYQLARSIEGLRDLIGNAVNEDVCIFEKMLEVQIDVLVVQPLRKAAEKRGGREGWPYVIAIDGLDECYGVRYQTHILNSINNSLIKHDVHFRIFIASRPEYAIRTALKGHLRDVAYRIELDDKYNPGNDIRLYLQRRLVDIGRISDVQAATDGTWPATGDVEKLVANASGQFIYAATVVKFVSQRQFSPVQRLQLLLTWSPDRSNSRNPFTALDVLYTSILLLAQDALKDETDDDLSIVRLLNRIQALEPYLFAENGNRISYLERFSFLSAGEIQGTLSDLHALVKVGDDRITYHHKSFRDFLDSPSRSRKYYIDTPTIYTELVLIFSKCVLSRNTSSEMPFNMFNFHPNCGMRESSHLWWSSVCWSTQDNRILTVLERFDLELWIQICKCEKTSDILSVPVEVILKTLIGDIKVKHAASERWFRIRTRLKQAGIALQEYMRLPMNRWSTYEHQLPH